MQLKIVYQGKIRTKTSLKYPVGIVNAVTMIEHTLTSTIVISGVID